MEAIINKLKSSLWWSAGFLCAFVFNHGANAADVSNQTEAQNSDFGNVPQEQPRINELERVEITKLIDDYYTQTVTLEPTIEKLLKFGVGAHVVLMDYAQAACDGAFFAAQQAEQANAAGNQKLATKWRSEQESASDSRESLVTLAQELETRLLTGSRSQLMVAKGNREPAEQRKVIRRAIAVRYGPPPGPNRQWQRRGIYKPPPDKPPSQPEKPATVETSDLSRAFSTIGSPPPSSMPKP
jgi:hypothetical protein